LKNGLGNSRIVKLIEMDSLGKARPVGKGVYEKKINYAGGLRLYYVKRGDAWILLLCAGDKSTQQADIKLAQRLKKGLK
jgi:putative addiction module killer protein